MDKLSENIQWAKTALSEWREVMTRGDETNKLIQKFCKQDVGKAEVKIPLKKCRTFFKKLIFQNRLLTLAED